MQSTINDSIGAINENNKNVVEAWNGFVSGAQSLISDPIGTLTGKSGDKPTVPTTGQSPGTTTANPTSSTGGLEPEKTAQGTDTPQNENTKPSEADTSEALRQQEEQEEESLFDKIKKAIGLKPLARWPASTGPLGTKNALDQSMQKVEDTYKAGVKVYGKSEGKITGMPKEDFVFTAHALLYRREPLSRPEAAISSFWCTRKLRRQG